MNSNERDWIIPRDMAAQDAATVVVHFNTASPNAIADPPISAVHGAGAKSIGIQGDLKEGAAKAPATMNNLSDKHPEVVQQLSGFADQACQELGDLVHIGTNQRPPEQITPPTLRVT